MKLVQQLILFAKACGLTGGPFSWTATDDFDVRLFAHSIGTGRALVREFETPAHGWEWKLARDTPRRVIARRQPKPHATAFKQLRALLSSKRLRQPLEISEDHVLSILMVRRAREEAFGESFFADPAWDILLELYAAHLGNRRMSIGDLAAAIRAPRSTISRWICALAEDDLVHRLDPDYDFVSLTSEGARKMTRLAGYWGSAFISI